MAKEQDLSNFAAFDLDDLLAEISQNNTSKKEVTAYLDRTFLMNMIKEYHDQTKDNEVNFTNDSKIDITEYNFTGADFRGIPYSDFALFDFRECDISAVKLDRAGINFFRELMLASKVSAQGLNFEGAYLGPLLTRRSDLGIESYIYLNLSNLNLAGTNFNNTNIEGLILENTNISGCTFINCKAMIPEQFAFSMGFESSIFYNDKTQDAEMKEQIKKLAQTLDPAVYYTKTYTHSQHPIFKFLSKFEFATRD
ncbi:MAG: pentapeptide repeat-containing protein [Rickettsiales bacterium]